MTARAELDLNDLESRLRTHVSTLAASPRVPGTSEHARAALYVREHLREARLEVSDDLFSDGAQRGLNIRARPPSDPADLPLLVIGAHYDSIPGSPGADDNASAVAALLEIARLLSSRPAGATPFARLELMAYDLEEYGLGGSRWHARNLMAKQIPLYGMISLEMLGYTDHRPGSQNLPPVLAQLYPDVGNFIGVCANERSQELMESVTAALKTVPGLPVESLAVPGNGELMPDVRRSDHSSFWDLGLPALMITDTSFFRNPHYHKESDRPETLDYPFLARVCAGAFKAVDALTRPQIP